MRHSHLITSLLTGVLCLASAATAAETPHARLDEKNRAFFQNYCVQCHNADKQKGNVRLDDVPFILDTVERADLWQKILNQINSGEMPPEDAKQPDRLAKTEFLDSLSHALMTARRSIGDSSGKITMRRLNRREYKNTIRDLLGVDINVRELPADGGAGTFDTVGSSLFMSSDQFEQYLALGRQALDEHFARFVSPAGAVSRRLHIEAEEKNAKIAQSLARRTDAHARYVKWTSAVDAAAQKPENAEAVKKIRGEKKGDDAHFYSQWQRLKDAPPPTELGFVDVVAARHQGLSDWEHYVPHHKAYVDHAATKTGALLTVEDVEVNPYQAFRIPGDWPAGRYVVRVRIAATKDTPSSRHFVEFGSQHDSGVRAVMSSHQVAGTMDQPQVLEIPVEFSPAKGRGFFFQEKGTYQSEDAARDLFNEAKKRNGIGPEFALWIDWIEVESAASAAAVPATPTMTRTIKERREVELHANAMVGGTYNGYFKGGYEAATKFLQTGMPQKGIPDEQEAKFRIRAFEQQGPTFERYLDDPLAKTGAYLTIYNVHKEEVITLPPDQPSGWLKTKHAVENVEPGNYMLRFRIGAVKNTPKERHFVELGARKDKDDFGLMQTFQVSGTTEAPQIIEVPVGISADSPRTFVLREKRDVKLDHELFIAAQTATGVGPVPALWIDWVEWEGPLLKQAPVAKTERIEVEKKTDELTRQIIYMATQHKNFEKWQAAGAVEADLPKFGFPTRYHADFRNLVWEGNHEWFQKYVDRPEAKSGMFLDNTINETSELVTDLPPDTATGEYVMRVRIGRVPDMPAERAFLTFVEASPVDKDDRTFLANKQVTATLDKPQVVELPFKVRPGGPRKFVLFEKRPLKKEGISLPGRTRAMKDPKEREPALWIDWIEYEGPLNKSDTMGGVEPVLFANTTTASEHDQAHSVIATFAKRAFRDNPPTDEYLNKLTALYDTRRKAGDAFDVAVRTPLSVVLASPRFLYLSELGEEKKPRTLTSLEFATRLSYFLWSAPPDEALLALARSSDLMNPDVLVREVNRMIASPKANEFVSGFVHQWLGMERLDFFQFDTRQFRDFDESAKAAARREVYETFAHVLRTNGSASDLLKCDYVIVNGLLATYYGIDGVSGDEFRQVPLPEGSPRGGLLGMAAVLAMGSNGERSSPVERGAWVLRKLLHDPPPPAPPNVPQITRLNGQPLTTRERLLAHQAEPQCASCHRAIDPIGFGLENFNAAGKWRTEDSFQALDANGRPARNGLKTWTIDPSAAFHKGPAFRDFFELRDIIASRPEPFARGLTENLISYALGRPFAFTDEELAASVVDGARKKNFAMRELIHAIVSSREFRTK